MKKFEYKRFVLILFISLTISLGTIHIQINIKENEPTNRMNTKPKPSAGPINLGAWIIIAGDRDDHEHIDLIKQGCNEVHEALVNRGFGPDDICYLGPIYGDLSPYQDHYSLRSNIQWAIEEWAPTRGVGATQGLGLYIFDHGGTNYLCNPGTDLTDSDLNTYLDNLEADTGCNRMVIIYEACHAGSFINPVSKHNRIIVTSTDASTSAHGDAIGGWAVFSIAFWSNIIMCRTIGEAFSAGRSNVIAYGYGSAQFPWIDDNHDEIGHETGSMGSLPNGGDGYDALNVWIGTGTNCPETTIMFFPYRMFLSQLTLVKPVWAVVNADSLIDKVFVRIIPPNWTPAEAVSDDEGTILVEDLGALVLELNDFEGDGNFTSFIEVGLHPDFWGLMGDYKMTIHARSQDGTIAEVESTYITLNEDGLAPPDTTPPSISITNPSSGAILAGIASITAEGDDDQALDKIQIYLDGNLVEEESMPSYYPYPEVSHSINTDQYTIGPHNVTAVAIDKANNTKSTSIIVSFFESSIPSYTFPFLILGSIIGVIALIMKIKKPKVLWKKP